MTLMLLAEIKISKTFVAAKVISLPYENNTIEAELILNFTLICCLPRCCRKVFSTLKTETR